MDITNYENAEEDGHLEETEHAETPINQGPREEEDHFHIKNEKYERHDVEPDVESDPGITDRIFAALVWSDFAGIWSTGPENPSGKQASCHEDRPDHDENKNFAEFCEHISARICQINEEMLEK
jgi:hypothetical protein